MQAAAAGSAQEVARARGSHAVQPPLPPPNESPQDDDDEDDTMENDDDKASCFEPDHIKTIYVFIF
jgi:hypothetical protein